MCRQFEVEEALSVLDFIFGGADLDFNETHIDPHSYFLSHSESLIHLDYVCVGLLVQSRSKLLKGDYIDCLRTMMNEKQAASAEECLEIASRIKKILYEAQIKEQREVIETQTYPQQIEKETYTFQCINDNS